MYIPQLVSSPVNGHLGYIQFFTTTNKAAMNIGTFVYSLYMDMCFFSYIVGICLTFSETATLFSEWLNHSAFQQYMRMPSLAYYF